MCFNESPGSTTNMVTEVLLHFLAASGGRLQDKASPRPGHPHNSHSLTSAEAALCSLASHWPLLGSRSPRCGSAHHVSPHLSLCLLSLARPPSNWAPARLSHPRPRPSCRRAGPRHPTPATASRPATKPVIVGLDLTGKLLLWDASLLLVMLSFLLESRRSGMLPTLADFSDPEADGWWRPCPRWVTVTSVQVTSVPPPRVYDRKLCLGWPRLGPTLGELTQTAPSD